MWCAIIIYLGCTGDCIGDRSGFGNSASDTKLHRYYFDKLAVDLNVKDVGEWYNVTKTDLKKGGNFMTELLASYDGSIITALKNVYPEHDWMEGKFNIGLFPNGYWKKKENQRSLFDKIGTSLGITNLDGWYTVSKESVAEQATSVLNLYGGSLIQALSEIYPEHNWQLWKFTRVKRNYWGSVDRQRQLFDDIAKDLNIRKPEDWFKVTVEEVKKRGGSAIVGSTPLHKVLSTLYPAYQKACKMVFDKLAKQLKISNHSDWLNVPLYTIQDGHAKDLIRQCGNSIQTALGTAYPEGKSQPTEPIDVSKLDRVPLGYWLDKANQRKFMGDVAKTLNIQKNDVYTHDINDLGGHGLLKHYNGSVTETLWALFPETRSTVKKAFSVPKGYWKNLHNQRLFLDKIAKQLNITSPGDWYTVTIQDIRKLGGSSLLWQYDGSLIKALSAVYPEHFWQQWNYQRPHQCKEVKRAGLTSESFITSLKTRELASRATDYYMQSLQYIQHNATYPAYLSVKAYLDSTDRLLSTIFTPKKLAIDVYKITRTTSKRQILLYQALQKIFPNYPVHLNYTHPTMLHITRKRMEFDVYIPSLSIAFEYQGQQHYHDMKMYMLSVEKQSERDIAKRQACKRTGVTLIEIPYWWDGKTESLQATIHKYRPEVLLAGSGSPISEQLPTQSTLAASVYDPQHAESWELE